MKKSHILYSISALALILAMIMAPIGCAPEEAEEMEPVTLNLSVAASLTDAMEEIGELYKEENPHVNIEFNFGSSGALQQQIEQGAPADIFMSAASKQMNELQEGGLLLDDTRIDLLQNELVLVVPKGFTAISEFTDLTKEEIELVAIGDPESVPAGKYAQEAFTTLGIWDELESGGKLMLGKDVRQVLGYVETEAVQAGAVYRTDAQISDKVDVAAVAPEDSHDPVTYPVALIKDSPNEEEAKALLDYLAGNEAGKVFEKYGFKTLQ
ncbi:MAG: molybdate ABC transporter substrate-binding protein [Firmicutes bacterium]|jgi:molybdate transport system substrate-binding protein|nr:molybdate ABC transporter substrate-binding protein [Bacillota bacterium]